MAGSVIFFVALVGILPVSVGGIIKSLISPSFKQKKTIPGYARLLSGKMLESIVSQPSFFTGEIIRRRNREHVSLFFRQKYISSKQVDDSSLAFLTTTNLKRAEEQRRNFPITYRQKKPSETYFVGSFSLRKIRSRRANEYTTWLLVGHACRSSIYFEAESLGP